MNLAIFFEGTGQGVPGKFTNVTRLHDACRSGDSQKLHLVPGLGTRFGAFAAGKIAGLDWRAAFADARRWFEANYRTVPADGIGTTVYLFGFSRGALLARHFTAWLDKLGVSVEYLGLWDTVDSVAGLDVSEECPGNVRLARHAIARDEQRRFFRPVPLTDSSRRSVGVGATASSRRQVVQMLFPGVHSDVGGLYADNHVIADVALAWVARPASQRGLRLKPGVRLVQKFDPSSAVLHDSRRLISNLWGILGSTPRMLDGIPLHPSCRYLRSSRK